jgi:pimeloyl-ACP methyl ester carboxylesterase
VLLLHGFPDSAALWRHQIPELVDAGHRVIAPDLRGFGESDRPDGVEHYTMPTLVGDVLGVLDSLGVSRAAVVGHDWGAALGWALAGFVPDRVRLATGVRRRARAGRAPGSVLIVVAAWLLALTAAALVVSFSAHYACIRAFRRQDAASVIEALLLDALMIVFTQLALGLSRAGQSARAERALVLACAAASALLRGRRRRGQPAVGHRVRHRAHRAGHGGGPGRDSDPPPRPGRPETLGLEHPGPRRGGRGQDRRTGAAALSAVRPGHPGDGPGATPDSAGASSS